MLFELAPLVAGGGALLDAVAQRPVAFDLVVDSHVRGTFTCDRSAVRQFREQGGGGLILVGSPACQLSGFGQTSYAASKAAMISMVRVWSVELASSA